MSKYDEDNKDFWELDHLLMSYRRQLGQKESLERRRRDLKLQFGENRKNTHNGGKTGILAQIDNLDKQIGKQIDNAIKSLIKVQDIINFLSQDNESWNVLCCRYIDGYGWDKIKRECYMGRRTAIRKWKSGMQELLTFKKIQEEIKNAGKKK